MNEQILMCSLEREGSLHQIDVLFKELKEVEGRLLEPKKSQSGQVHVRQKMWNASRIRVSSLRRGHANLLCIVPILSYVRPTPDELLCSSSLLIHVSVAGSLVTAALLDLVILILHFVSIAILLSIM